MSDIHEFSAIRSANIQYAGAAENSFEIGRTK